MTFVLDKVVPWGRSFDEYVCMFALSVRDLEKRILGCSDGPASFNCVLTERGGHVISVDPLYRLSRIEIERRIDDTYDEVMRQTRENTDEFVWDWIGSVEELGAVRMAAMREFLCDYSRGRKEGRYLDASLPSLPFEDKAFDLALCSHFLFLYSAQLSVEFHIQSIKELCRVSSEARIFPLLELGSKRSRHLARVLDYLSKDGFTISVESVPYEFQKGGNEMMRVRRS